MSMRSKTADGHEGSEAAVGASVPPYEAPVVAASDGVLPIVGLTAGPPTDTREAVSGSDRTGSG